MVCNIIMSRMHGVSLINMNVFRVRLVVKAVQQSEILFIADPSLLERRGQSAGSAGIRPPGADRLRALLNTGNF